MGMGRPQARTKAISCWLVSSEGIASLIVFQNNLIMYERIFYFIYCMLSRRERLNCSSLGLSQV
jgi:hypothetical protein